MATDLEKLVVSLDADIRQLTNKLNKAGVAVETFGRKADRDSAAAAKKISDNLSKATTGGHGGGHGGGGEAPGALSYSQKQEFTHIGKSIADEIAAGQSPLRAIQVEGGRIVQAFSSGPGGVGGTFKALASTLGGLVSPAALAAAGVLGIGLAAALAYSSFDEAERRIRLGLLGIGAASGATVSDIRRIGAELAVAQGISTGAGEDIALSLAKTGRIDVRSIGDVGKLTRGYAALTGQDLGEAGKSLGDIFADPAKGAETLNRLLGTLDSKTKAYIGTLQAQGDVQGALNALLTAASPQILQAAEATSSWGRAWQSFKNDVSSAGEMVARVVKGPQADDRDIGRLRAQLETTERAQAAGQSQSPTIRASRDAVIADLRRQIAELEGKASASEKAAQDKQDTIAAARDSDRIKADARGVEPDAERIRDLENRIADIKRAVLTPGAVTGVEGGADQVKATLASLDSQLAELKRTYAQGGEAAAAALRQAEFGKKTAELDGYAARLAEINHRFDEMALAARRAGQVNALPTIEAARSAEVDAAGAKVVKGRSKFAHGVSDAPEAYQPLILSAAAKSNVDPDFLASILYQESRFKPGAVSPAGAQGIAQFMPGTARENGVTNPFDPNQAIPGAARYLRTLQDEFGDEKSAAAAYNAGPNRYRQFLAGRSRLPQETLDYVPAVTGSKTDFDRGSQAQKSGDEALAQAKRQLAEAQTGVSRAADVEAQSEASLQRMRQAGLPIDDAARAKAKAEAEQLVQLAEATKLAQAAKQIRQERSDLGLSPGEASIRSRVRGFGFDPTSGQGADLAGQFRDAQAAMRQAEAARDVARERADLGMTSSEASIQGRVRGFGLDPTAGQGADLAGQLRQIQAAGEVKNEATSSIQDLTHALIEGRDAGEALHNVLQRITEKVADKAIDGLVSSAVGAVTGGAGGGGGAGSGIFATIGSLLGIGHATGTIVRGPGGPTADRVPAMLSAGEAVLPAVAVRQNPALVKALIGGRYAAGGVIGTPRIPSAVQPRSGAGAGPVDNRRIFQVDARGAQAGVGPQIQAALEAYDAQLPSRLTEHQQRFG